MLPSDAGKTSSERDALIAAARCASSAGAIGMTSACPPFVVSRKAPDGDRSLDEIHVGVPEAAQLALAHAREYWVAKNARYCSGTSLRTMETCSARSVDAILFGTLRGSVSTTAYAANRRSKSKTEGSKGKGDKGKTTR
jgi:hypothetical protein